MQRRMYTLAGIVLIVIGIDWLWRIVSSAANRAQNYDYGF